VKIAPLAFLALTALVSARAGAGETAAGTPIAPYARVLQHFNPRLDDETARQFAAATIERADREGLDARLLVALIAVESRWDPAARSRAGARGLGQLMPQTAASLGVDAGDPLDNIAGAARHLHALLTRFGKAGKPDRYALALAAYNAGSEAVMRYGGVPPFLETRTYVRRVIRLWYRLAGWQPPAALRRRAGRIRAGRIRAGRIRAPGTARADRPRAPFPR
jgi:soluble lytic murein transglycosylase-like protein